MSDFEKPYIEAGVLSIFTTLTEQEFTSDISSVPLVDVGVSSLKIMQFVSLLYREYGVMIDLEKFLDGITISDIANEIFEERVA